MKKNNEKQMFLILGLLRSALEKATTIESSREKAYDSFHSKFTMDEPIAEMRSMLEKALTLAADGHVGRLKESMEFIDSKLKENPYRPNPNSKKSPRVSKWRERLKKWREKRASTSNSKKPDPAITPTPYRRWKDREKRRLIVALDSILTDKTSVIQNKLFVDASNAFDEARSERKRFKEAATIALKIAADGHQEFFDKAIAIALPKMKRKVKGIIIGLSAIVFIAMFIVAIKLWPTEPVTVPTATTTIETTAPETTPVTVAETTAPETTPTPSTWLMVAGDYENNRWFSDGIAEIKSAKTKADAEKAAKVWLDKIKRDPNLLVAVLKYFLHEDVDKASLVDEKNYATDKAVQLVAELEIAIGMAEIEVAKAPSDGYNSGAQKIVEAEDKTSEVVEETVKVVRSEKKGITGDTKAVMITLEDGTVIWVLSRCGNIVTKEEPDLPPGKTDEPKLDPKDASQDVLANEDVEDWKKNENGEQAVVESEDFQADPVKDAEIAADDAEVAADKAVDEADAAKDEAISSGAGVVDSGANYGEVKDPTVIDKDW